MNLVTLHYNDNKMPIWTDKRMFFDSDHFTFKSFDEVRLPILSDIFYFWVGYFSIGDIIMIIAILLMSIHFISCVKTKRFYFFHREKRKGR